MAKFDEALWQMNTLEDLANKDTTVHHLSPFLKTCVTLCYLVAVVSFSRYEMTGLLVMACLPILVMAIAEIPYQPLLKRLCVALPFVLFAGISNLILDRDTAFFIGNVAISYGAVSFVTLLFKTVLTVMAVLILMATTPMMQINDMLLAFHIPSILVWQVTLSYRYLSLLVEEARSMHTAYRLRSGGEKGVHIMHMGSFVGQLLLRSMEKAERVFYAMKCRGYGMKSTQKGQRVASVRTIGATAFLCALLIILRLLPYAIWFGKLI